jgi:hypothetical protein
MLRQSYGYPGARNRYRWRSAHQNGRGVDEDHAEAALGSQVVLVPIDRVRQIAALPQLELTQPSVLTATPQDLPVVMPPAPDAPVLAVINSGAASSHPMLVPAVLGVDWAGGIGDGGDHHGHGIMVASLALMSRVDRRDPPVRPTRLDYLASHMDIQVYFGVPVGTVRWDTPGARQAYALAVELECDTHHADLYPELLAPGDMFSRNERDTPQDLTDGCAHAGISPVSCSAG